ncbi:MAG: class E sortase [Acidimicrobiales bacterium]
MNQLRSRRTRRALSALSVVLVLAGAGVLAYPFVTNLYQHRLQSHLGHQLASPDLRARYRQRRLLEGDSLTRIRIPAIGVDVVVVQGTSASALRAGAGHYPETPLPCDVGNVGIAGHRTTYGKPFANIDRLKPGDTIELDTPIGGCVYRIVPAPARYQAIDPGGAPFVVDKTEMSVVDPTPDRELTLTSCHPKGSASHRIVIRAVWQRDVASA